MSALHAYIDGIALIGPGLSDWTTAAPVLAGRRPYEAAATVIPVPTLLPPAERRRTGQAVRIALAAGLDVAERAGRNPADLPAVFTSSGGDGDNCHEICEVLASADRQLSPTRFHNSVHNAPAGYWSIATGAMAASTSLCAYDASFAAGLLEALSEIATDRGAVLLVAYDVGYPAPMRSRRPIPDAFATALVFSLTPGPRSVAKVSVTLREDRPTSLSDPGLDALRRAIPAARSLPLLSLIAFGSVGSADLEYQGRTCIHMEFAPC